MAPRSRIQATAADVSRPPENAMPTRSPTGSFINTLEFEAGSEAAAPSAEGSSAEGSGGA